VYSCKWLPAVGTPTQRTICSISERESLTGLRLSHSFQHICRSICRASCEANILFVQGKQTSYHLTKTCGNLALRLKATVGAMWTKFRNPPQSSTLKEQRRIREFGRESTHKFYVICLNTYLLFLCVREKLRLLWPGAGSPTCFLSGSASDTALATVGSMQAKR
jgi:hypothetical protein